MDTEKLLEIEHKIETGKSLSDEGPYYHHAHWEAYKGASKGELGGTITGIIIGSAVGLVAAAATIFTPYAAAAVPIFLACTAGGMAYGVHKFTNVGVVAGATASVAHQGEMRMRAYEEGKFAELKDDIGEVKALLKGESPPRKPNDAAKIKEDLDSYRKTHYARTDTPNENRYVFWKIAVMGLVVGMLAGAILAATGGVGHLLANLGLAAAGHGAGHAGAIAIGEYAASMFAFGALGASLGINRDVFRRIFDKTDLWFKGIFSSKEHALVEKEQVQAGKALTKEKSKPPEVATFITNYEGQIDYPASGTFHRDRVTANADKALLAFDHTRARPH